MEEEAGVTSSDGDVRESDGESGRLTREEGSPAGDYGISTRTVFDTSVPFRVA